MAHLSGDVVAEFCAHQRRAGRGRVVQMYGHRQRVIAHVNRLSRKPRLLWRVRNDGGDRFADKANPPYGKRMTRCGSRWRAVRAHKSRNTRHRLNSRYNQISPSRDEQHARHRQRSLRINRCDLRVRIRRAQKEKMGQPVRCHIISELPSSLEQQIVLNTTNVFAAAEGAHAASTGIDGICCGGLSYCVQGSGP